MDHMDHYNALCIMVWTEML